MPPDNSPSPSRRSIAGGSGTRNSRRRKCGRESVGPAPVRGDAQSESAVVDTARAAWAGQARDRETGGSIGAVPPSARWQPFRLGAESLLQGHRKPLADPKHPADVASLSIRKCEGAQQIELGDVFGEALAPEICLTPAAHGASRPGGCCLNVGFCTAERRAENPALVRCRCLLHY